MNEIRKHQLAHIEIYKAMLKVAKNNNIKIFAFYGTMLGLKRHNGFIPWDDDVDVAIWNEEYEKFITALEKELPKKFSVERRSKNWDFSAEEAVVYDNEKIIYADQAKTIKRKYSVDIFRFAFLKKEVKKVPFKRNFWRGIQFIGNKGDSNIWAKIARQLITHTLTGKFVHNKVDKIDKKISTKNPKESLLAYDMSDGWSKAFNSKSFTEIEIKKLEGVEIYMPKNPSYFLTSNYGDWKKQVKWDDKLHYF